MIRGRSQSVLPPLLDVLAWCAVSREVFFGPEERGSPGTVVEVWRRGETRCWSTNRVEPSFCVS